MTCISGFHFKEQKKKTRQTMVFGCHGELFALQQTFHFLNGISGSSQEHCYWNLNKIFCEGKQLISCRESNMVSLSL